MVRVGIEVESDGVRGSTFTDMNEWFFLFILLCVSVPAFILFFRFFRKFRFIGKLGLYLPIFYLLVTFFAIALHFVLPTPVIGSGKIQFSIGSTIGIFSSFPGLYAVQIADQLGIHFPSQLDSALYWIPLLVLLNFVLYWALNVLAVLSYRIFKVIAAPLAHYWKKINSR